MASIRPLEREDLPAVAELIRSHIGWRRDPAVLERSLIDHPWAASEPSTLVAVDDAGRVIGSIGAQERPLLFEGTKLRAVCVSHLVVEPQQRAGAAGALLVRTLLSGDQDLTFTDSGTEEVVRIWAAFGADVDHSRTGGWMVVTSPARWLARAGGTALRRGESRRRFLPTAALPLHLAGRRLIPQAFPEPAPDVEGTDAAPGEIAEALPMLKNIRLRIDYDTDYLSWLFAHVASLGSPLSHRIVRRRGRPIGWYVYIRRETARLIHLAAAARQAEEVFANFAAHAQAHGALALAGRTEPNLDEPLRRRMAAIGLAQRPLVHARDPQLRAALGSSGALLTEMDLIDSEWW